MRKSDLRITVAVALAALVLAGAAVGYIATRHDSDPSGDLPDIVAPSVEPPSPTPLHTAEPTPEPTKRPAPERVTFVGDSIMVAAEPQLRLAAPGCVIDAEVGRPIADAMQVLRSLDSAGLLYETVVIGLGSNSVFSVE